MRADLSHLPRDRQRELGDFVLRTILSTFEDAHARSATGWKKKGRIHKIVLYGSFARGGWVYEPHTTKGYSSDYDLLVMVNRKQVVENVSYWADLEDCFIKARLAGRMKSLPSVIVHTRQEVHNALTEGRYFFMDIIKDGIVLYDADQTPFPKPRPRTPEDKLALAEEYFTEGYRMGARFFEAYKLMIADGGFNIAAFQLHQCVENLYHTALLTMTYYAPHSHNIKNLRELADKLDRRFALIWPREFRWQTAAFNILRDAYVKARYSKRGYKITESQLHWLAGVSQDLAQVVREVCEERIEELRNLVESSGAYAGVTETNTTRDNR